MLISPIFNLQLTIISYFFLLLQAFKAALFNAIRLLIITRASRQLLAEMEIVSSGKKKSWISKKCLTILVPAEIILDQSLKMVCRIYLISYEASRLCCGSSKVSNHYHCHHVACCSWKLVWALCNQMIKWFVYILSCHSMHHYSLKATAVIYQQANGSHIILRLWYVYVPCHSWLNSWVYSWNKPTRLIISSDLNDSTKSLERYLWLLWITSFTNHIPIEQNQRSAKFNMADVWNLFHVDETCVPDLCKSDTICLE